MNNLPTVWTDDRILTALHLLAEGSTASQVARRLGVSRSGVLGINFRVRRDYAESCKGDPDPDRHDASETWEWVRKGLDRPRRAPL